MPTTIRFGRNWPRFPARNLEKSFPDYIGRLPIAVRVEVSNGFRLTAFLASLRAYIEQTSPGMVRWESLKYKDQPYVKVTPTERAKGQHKELEKVAIYYVGLRRRPAGHAQRERAETRDRPATGPRRPSKKDGNAGRAGRGRQSRGWARTSACRSTARRSNSSSHLNRDEYQLAMQARAWSNLPILNEWKRLYPDQDPVELHERVWKIRLICPGGGRYVWNDKYQTMESTVYGHPGEPKTGPPPPPALTDFANGSFGLTFEHQGLRARVSLERQAGEKASQPKLTIALLQMESKADDQDANLSIADDYCRQAAQRARTSHSCRRCGTSAMPTIPASTWLPSTWPRCESTAGNRLAPTSQAKSLQPTRGRPKAARFRA